MSRASTPITFVVAFASFAAACAESPVPPAETPAAPSASAEAPATASAPAPAPSAAPAPKPAASAPAASPEPPAAAAPPAAPAGPYRFETKSSSGRPLPRYGIDKEIETTIGGSGGVFVVGGAATLFIPDGALRDGINVYFGVDPKAKAPRGGVGGVYRVAPRAVSAGAKFQLAFALPQGTSKVSFAIESTQPDAKGKPKTDWTIVPASHVDEAKKLVVLDLDALPEGHVALTTAEK